MVNTEYKHILKVHEDILTVPDAITELFKEYKNIGYEMMRKVVNSFTYRLADGTVIIVYWEKGAIYEDIAVLPKIVN
ncbi:hypothetical protein [Anaerocolumna sp. MB42-C2]|uniref:hypothetical protein n=1 Tax=Anaerocolumna sp. MB42-C2 TaxID=3070997 RepID=UPI0027DF56AA|nr:hypothetical protein [Anaerocolumna sp. MB42-C2]WMJ88534.1 hypothetical protein RBU59_03190 [Anaerocolumna sp. MB42-C2]